MHIVYRTSSVLVHSSFHLDHHTPAWDHEEDARTLSLSLSSIYLGFLYCHAIATPTPPHVSAIGDPGVFFLILWPPLVSCWYSSESG